MNGYNELIERLAVSAGDQECLYSDAKEAMVVLLCAYKSVAKQLHDAEDVLKQNVLNEFWRIGVIDGQPGWIQHYCHERKEVVKDPLTLDGELHCTILPAVEAIKAERDSLQSRVAELEAERAEREKQEPIATVGWDRNFMGVVWHGKDMPEKGVETLLYAAPPVTEQGCVTVTTDESGRAVAVTRQDDEHRILSVIWEAPVTAPVRLTDRDKDGLAVPYSGMGGIEDYRAYAQDIEAAVLRANGFKVDNQ